MIYKVYYILCESVSQSADNLPDLIYLLRSMVGIHGLSFPLCVPIYSPSIYLQIMPLSPPIPFTFSFEPIGYDCPPRLCFVQIPCYEARSEIETRALRCGCGCGRRFVVATCCLNTRDKQS
jgi:hypothetical protein